MRRSLQATPPHDDEEQPRFINHYCCPQCGHRWTDVWSATCDDDCPCCGTRHISPHTSDDAPRSDMLEEPNKRGRHASR